MKITNIRILNINIKSIFIPNTSSLLVVFINGLAIQIYIIIFTIVILAIIIKRDIEKIALL